MSGTKQECAGWRWDQTDRARGGRRAGDGGDRGAQPREYSRCAGAQQLSAIQLEGMGCLALIMSSVAVIQAADPSGQQPLTHFTPVIT
jgi:hypothetical protein